MQLSDLCFGTGLLQEGDDRTTERYRDFASKSSILTGFPTALSLLQGAHGRTEDGDRDPCDGVLRELSHLNGDADPELRQGIVLLILMPAVHKTSRQIKLGFPSLEHDDIAQHLFTAVLQILRSRTLLRQESHFAFTITRLMRRLSFRWALHETRPAPVTGLPTLSSVEPAVEASGNVEPKVLLQEFLDGCLSNGLLTETEHELFVLFKIEGVASEVLGAREGMSGVVLRHRMQRVIDRLRTIAQSSSWIPRRPESCKTSPTTGSAGCGMTL